MIYIFEDREADIISKLFKAAYDEVVYSKFIYANGNGSIISIVDEQLENTQEDIAIFLDMIPGNKDIVKIYHSLKKRYITSKGRVLVLPIVCSEYYFLKSIASTNLLKVNKNVIDTCINRGVYFNSEIIQTEEDRRFCKNFEKFCKLILIKGVIECAKHSRGYGVNECSSYGVYYTTDCKCKNPLHNCKDMQLLEKSIRLLSEYPCVPRGNKGSNRALSSDDMIQIHRELVDSFNEMSTRYEAIDKDNSAGNKYKRIPYIM